MQTQSGADSWCFGCTRGHTHPPCHTVTFAPMLRARSTGSAPLDLAFAEASRAMERPWNPQRC